MLNSKRKIHGDVFTFDVDHYSIIIFKRLAATDFVCKIGANMKIYLPVNFVLVFKNEVKNIFNEQTSGLA